MFLNYTELITPCTSKSRENKDRYLFSGIIEANIPQLATTVWNNAVQTQVVRLGDNHGSIICVFRLNATCYIWGFPEGNCTCVYSPGRVYFTIEYFLQTFDSSGQFRVIWDNDLGPFLYTQNISLPEICDINTALLTLTVGGRVPYLSISNRCIFSITLDTSNALLLCCSKMAMPCYPQISFQGSVVANNESPCVTYVPTSNRITGTMVLSYSVCSKNEYMTGNNCTKRAGAVSTKATTTTTSTTTSTTRKTTRTTTTTRPTTTTTATTVTTTTTDEDITDDMETSTEAEITDDMAPQTDSPKKINILQMDLLFWIIANVVVVLMILLVLAYKMISRKRRVNNNRRQSSNAEARAAAVPSPAVNHVQKPQERFINNEEHVSETSVSIESDVDTGSTF